MVLGSEQSCFVGMGAAFAQKPAHGSLLRHNENYSLNFLILKQGVLHFKNDVFTGLGFHNVYNVFD